MIKINHLSKQFNNVNVLENINLNIEDGICTALIGKNGAGKSTLIDIIIGNKAIDFGEIIDEHSLINRKHMAVLYQKTHFLKLVKVKELFNLYCSLYQEHISKEDFMNITNFDEQLFNQWASKLSGGQQRILDFALTVTGKPKLLVLDEPTTAMDIETREHFWKIINRFKSEGMTILYTTHYIEEVERMADQIALLENGHIKIKGDINKIKSLEPTSYIYIPLKYKDEVQKLAVNFIFKKSDQKFEIKTKQVKDILIEMMNQNIDLNEIEIYKSSLLEVLFNKSNISEEEVKC